MKHSKGITLVALVVTIIILLILAGISIAQLTGNGLFEEAKIAKEKYKNAQDDEEDKIAKYSNEIERYVAGKRDEINNVIKLDYKNAKNVASAVSGNTYNITEDGFLFFKTNSASDGLEMWIYIDDIYLEYFYEEKAYGGVNFSAPVTNGDVFKFTSSKDLNGFELIFIPYKQ